MSNDESEHAGYQQMVGIMLRGVLLLLDTVEQSTERMAPGSAPAITASLAEHRMRLRAAEAMPQQVVPPEAVERVCRAAHQFQAQFAALDPEAPVLDSFQIQTGCMPRHLPMSGEQLRDGVLFISKLAQDMAEHADWDKLARYLSVLGEYDYELGRATAMVTRESLRQSTSS